MAKYKITSGPTFCGDGSTTDYFSLGEIVEVPEGVTPDRDGDYLVAAPSDNGTRHYIAAKDLTKVEEPATFSRGDRVVALDSTNGMTEGAIGEVTTDQLRPTDLVGVKFDARRTVFVFAHRLARDPEPTAPTPEPRELLDANAVRDLLSILNFDEERIEAFIRATTAQPE